MKKPTQQDVARLANVSRATVSFVVNGKDTMGVPISEETRQRVLDAVEKLGYVVNAGAQALRSGDTKTIGVMLPIYENPFFLEILKGISREANESGYKVLLANSALDDEQASQTVSELAEQRVDGLILLMEFDSLPARIMDQLRNSTHPIVEGSPSSLSEFDLIRQEYGEGMSALMSYLIELGHRRIGYIHGVQESTTQGLDRLKAYEQAFVDANLPQDPRWIYRCGPSMEEGYQTAFNVLQQEDRPTALIAVNDLLAIAAISAATDLGLRVPDDVSIAGFDDIPFARFAVPKLTTVASAPEQKGRAAVQLLLKRLREPDRPREVITARWELIVRESTGSAPSL
ncbi:LacI family DNA-binding transcriptional regulator [Phototrophicus methaneseepsis]|uniref:LacI family DNA-binding transcriptional regulator n=1 Tax=Phototrophicus methaneseepsis TaxID=2710758 RepID=A0A7S8EBC9_9CHLR|nr:LacI family DNA-binding transcriptional regulator [Phototrophicus methaneseepsis]QPC83734.1 LacI family DNA-binding transcriptional regulator [Phototrophicus methaneseepsis]